jgi:Domain of unknown function (DUF4157)
MTRERVAKPVQVSQPQRTVTPAQPISAPQKPGRLTRTLEARISTPAELEAKQTQQLEIQRSRNLEAQARVVQRAHLERSTAARVAQTKHRTAGTRSLGVQRAISEHLQSARAAQTSRADFVAGRSTDHLESMIAQRLEAVTRPALEPVQRQSDLTLSHVADHMDAKAQSQITGNPDALRNLQGFKNAGATLVGQFRAPGSRHTMPQLAGAIQRFRDPWQRAAVEASAYAAFGSHPSFPGQLQRALDEQDHHLEVQREAWKTELEPRAQRLALEEASGENAANLIEAARGGGQPLPENVRAMLEVKWNTDLSRVRVHTDSSADVVSKKLNAKALTTGNDVFYRAGTWNPTSLEGLQLIAHETWHTVQQANGLVQAGVDKSHSLELEARGKGAELSSSDLTAVSSGAGLKTKSTRTPKPAATTRTSSSTKVAQRAVDTATPTPASSHSTSTRSIGNLDGLSSSAPIFGAPSVNAPVQRAADGTPIQRAWWNPFDWAVAGAKWLGASFMDGLEWMGERAAKVFMEVFAAAAKPFGATGKMVLEAIRNIGKPLLSILENPGRFATNLIQGVKQGFMGFATNAPQHLTGVLGSFLGGKGLSLTFPTKLEPLPILMAFITTLNLGWDVIRAKIAKQLGPKGNQALALAEKSVPMVKQLSGGLHNTQEFTKEVMPTLKTQAVDGVKSAAQEGLIRAGINALLKLIPGAGTVMAIFDTVRVLIDRARDISSLVSNVMGAFGAIAGGNVSSAAIAVESSLVSGIKIALNFVAKLTKIDTFIDRVRGIIGKVTTKISSVVNPLIARAVKLVQPLLDKLGGKGDPKGKPDADSRTVVQKQTAVNKAAKEADVYMRADEATVESVKTKLPALKKKYQLGSIELIEEKDGESHVTASINPTATTPSRRLKKKEHREFYPENMDVKPTTDGVLITYTTRAGKNFEVSVGRSGHVTQAQGFDLDLTKLGRGVTEDPANKEKNAGQNSAHVIANWFGGSGYKKSLNLIATSDHFNKVVMGNAEDRIVAWVKSARIEKFNLNVSVDWGTVKEEDAMNRIIEQAGLLSGLAGNELQKSKREILKRLSSFKAILKAIEDVEYMTSGIDSEGKTKSLRPINTGKDTWLK